jgi:hypothetical protein
MLALYIEAYGPATSRYGWMDFVGISRELEPVHMRLTAVPAVQPVPFAYVLFASCKTFNFSICLARKHPAVAYLTRHGHIGVRCYLCIYVEHPDSYRLEVLVVNALMRFEQCIVAIIDSEYVPHLI